MSRFANWPGAVALVAILVFTSTPASAGVGLPTFSKSFNPSTIGPGSVSTLRFDIVNVAAIPIDNLAFSDTLPAGMTIASAANAISDCGGTLSAPNSGTTISLTSGQLAPSASCSLFVDVTTSAMPTAGSPVLLMNVSGDLTSDAGNSGSASATLTVEAERPGFTKSFSPSTVPAGGGSTLTLTIDNTANPAAVTSLSFTDNLPPGLVVASPTAASTTCGTPPLTPTLTADPGTATIDFSFFGVGGFVGVAAGASCTVTVNVVTQSAGTFPNITEELSADAVSSGKATATLSAPLNTLNKVFTDDPVPPGGTVTLEFTVVNVDRSSSATGIAFSDDLDAVLPGLTTTGPLPSDPCGVGSSLSVTPPGLLALSGGTLPPEGSCTFSVTLQVPGTASTGAFLNTTSAIALTVGGVPTTGNMASDTLDVAPIPLLTKTFLDDPVSAGSSTRMEFTITNSSSTSMATDIAFIDELTTFMPFPVSVTLPAVPCNAGSMIALVSLGTDRQGLSLTGGNLGPGLSCTFEVTLDIPLDLAPGILTNTTRDITATVDAATVIGPPASADFEVVAAPMLSKSFPDDPVPPGGTVTLEFTLTHGLGASTDATAITFTDDLNAALAGLMALGLPINDVCGTGSQISGTTNLSFTGGTLAPGASCTFSVTLQVPAGASSGSFTNTTSTVTATVAGVAAESPAASDDLDVSALLFTKSFTDDPVIPGGNVTLEFIIDNVGTVDATGIIFTDNLDAVVAGLAATGLPMNDVCGTGSTLDSAGSLLFLVGGNLLAGTSCTFSVVLDVPATPASGTFTNTTSFLSSSLGSSPPAVDQLVIDSVLLQLTKTFTDDPAPPGGTVTLEFTLDNLDLGNAASAITFTDDLDAVLSGLGATGLPINDVCGTGSQVSGSSTLTLTGGNLPAGGSCTFSVTLAVPPGAPAGATFTNTTSAVAGTITGLAVSGDPASADLRISSLITFSKTFLSPAFPGGTSTLRFTITNGGAAAVNGLGFMDDLGAVLAGLAATGLPISDVCGAGSQLSQAGSVLTFSNGNLAALDTCTFDVPLQVPGSALPGSFLNTTGDLFDGADVVSAPATASLTIEPPPLFSKSFTPAFVGLGGGSTLSFEIDNSANTLTATGLAFTDTLPAGVEVANPANASISGCTGGTVTAVPGSGTVSYGGGGSVAGATVCTISVDVVGTALGAHLNTSGALTSSAGSSGTASATLTVVSDLSLTKTFLTSPVLPGGSVALEFTIFNATTATVGSLAFTDDLGAALAGLAAVGLPASDVCGAGSTLNGTSVLSLVGGTLAPGATCTFQVTVRVPATAPLGSHPNVTSPVTGLASGAPITTGGARLANKGAPVSGPAASADLVVAFLDFTKAFGGGGNEGSTVPLTFTLTNSDPANTATALTFADDLDAVLPGLVAVGLPAADVCGLGSLVNGTSIVVLTGGVLGPGATCSFTVSVQIPVGTIPGTFTNVTSPLDAVVDGSPVAGGPASAANADLSVGGGVISIPTLGTWGFLALAALLALLGVRRLRPRIRDRYQG